MHRLGHMSMLQTIHLVRVSVEHADNSPGGFGFGWTCSAWLTLFGCQLILLSIIHLVLVSVEHDAHDSPCSVFSWTCCRPFTLLGFQLQIDNWRSFGVEPDSSGSPGSGHKIWVRTCGNKSHAPVNLSLKRTVSPSWIWDKWIYETVIKTIGSTFTRVGAGLRPLVTHLLPSISFK